MLFKKALIATAITSISMNTFAAIRTVVDVTPDFLAAKQGILMPWQLSNEPNNFLYDFDVENQTDANIKVTIKTSPAAFPEDMYLDISGSSDCDSWAPLKPSQSVTCTVEPNGHFEMTNNMMHSSSPIGIGTITGTFKLSR